MNRQVLREEGNSCEGGCTPQIASHRQLPVSEPQHAWMMGLLPTNHRKTHRRSRQHCVPYNQLNEPIDPLDGPHPLVSGMTSCPKSPHRRSHSYGEELMASLKAMNLLRLSPSLPIKKFASPLKRIPAPPLFSHHVPKEISATRQLPHVPPMVVVQPRHRPLEAYEDEMDQDETYSEVSIDEELMLAELEEDDEDDDFVHPVFQAAHWSQLYPPLNTCENTKHDAVWGITTTTIDDDISDQQITLGISAVASPNKQRATTWSHPTSHDGMHLWDIVGSPTVTTKKGFSKDNVKSPQSRTTAQTEGTTLFSQHHQIKRVKKSTETWDYEEFRLSRTGTSVTDASGSSDWTAGNSMLVNI